MKSEHNLNNPTFTELAVHEWNSQVQREEKLYFKFVYCDNIVLNINKHCTEVWVTVPNIAQS